MQIVTAIAMVILFNVLYSIADKEIEKRKLQPTKQQHKHNAIKRIMSLSKEGSLYQKEPSFLYRLRFPRRNPWLG